MNVARFVAIVDSPQLAANAPTAVCVLASDYDALRKALGELLDEIDTLEHITFTRDVELYKAEAIWDDVLSRAQDAFKESA